MDDDPKDQIESLLAIPNESMSTPVPWLARELLRRSLSALRQRDEALERAERTLRAIADSDAWAGKITPVKVKDVDDESLRDERINSLLQSADKAATAIRATLTGSETNAR